MAHGRSPHVASLIDDEEWNVASGDGPAGPFFFRWRTPILQPGETSGYDRLLRISWHFALEGSRELPPPASDEQRARFEADIVAVFEHDYHAVLTCVWTYDGAAEWAFYTADVSECGARVGRMPHPYGKYPISLQADDDPDWTYFREVRLGSIDTPNSP